MTAAQRRKDGTIQLIHVQIGFDLKWSGMIPEPLQNHQRPSQTPDTPVALGCGMNWKLDVVYATGVRNYHIFFDDGVDSGDISAFSSDHIKQRNVTYPRQCKMAATKVGDKCARTAPHAATAAVTRRLRCVPFPDVVGMEYR
ncbi:hypothetical protein F2P81_025193 [Scophthalmus maximus]|uniref:Uncharacterized protein n=1 Tax=Scophthalmus maximus TaxID=52904 RepID=A0A6A4RQL3_SCOMX|nr:hypothetical protein F2P81_025193 [Scophthalmus maximus]